MPRLPGRGRYQRRPDSRNQIRRNERIRARQVRLIGPDGKQVGVVAKDEALKMAKAYGLDLVEVAGNSDPPVCRILDFGKYKYELSKRGKDKASSGSKMKEVKFRVRIEQHDYMTKLRRAEEFLFKGNKLKVTLMFRGREMEHTDLGFNVVNRAVEDLAHVGIADNEARLNGRFINLNMSPLPQNKRKLKFNETIEPGDSDDDDADHEED